jgi:hypothetical protein
MISEYALGKHKWLITSFFVFWGVSSLTLGIALWPLVNSTWATVGVVVLFISVVGEIMGGLFDIKHKLHGVSFMLGVPAVPVAAMLIGNNLMNASWLVILSSHATWISLVVMAVAMIVMISGFKKAGIPMGPDVTPPETVPDGVIALAGYANRLLVICYVGWLIVVANFILNQ